MDKTMLKVGELASLTALTVRTLHHYDEVGLLRPAERTAAGHRLYGADEIRRLQQITSLRHLGLSLEEVAECLARPEYGVARVLRMQRDRIREQIGRQETLLATISHLIERLGSDEAPDVEEVTEVIRMTMEYEKYYSWEQLTQLRERAESVGEARMQESQREWQRLLAAFTRAMEDGLDPTAPEVRMLCTSYDALIAEFTGGDPNILASLTKMYRSEGGDRVMERHGMSTAPGLWEYIGRARAPAHP
jgi:DNA-binding transcriptional MerR regulator